MILFSHRLISSLYFFIFFFLFFFIYLFITLHFFIFFFFNDPAPPEFSPLPLHAALPIWCTRRSRRSSSSPRPRCTIRHSAGNSRPPGSRSGTASFRSRTATGSATICRPILLNSSGCRRRSEEHTSELQSLAYLVCRLLLE